MKRRGVSAVIKVFHKIEPYLDKGRALSVQDIAKITGLSVIMVRRHLKFLVEWNFLVVLRKGRYKYYTKPEVIEQKLIELQAQ